MHTLMATASHVIEAPDPACAADTIDAWLRSAGIRSPHTDTFTRTARPAAALRPVITEVLARHGRAHTRIRRLDDLDGQTRIAILDWSPDDVPQLVWPCAVPDQLRASSRPDQRLLRVVIAMMLVRMHGTPTWADAGAVLAIPPDKARNWTRYAFSARFAIKQDLLEAARQLAYQLPRQPAPHAWANRPEISGYGVTALAGAQRPPCRRDDPTSQWCPCQGTALALRDTTQPPPGPTARHGSPDDRNLPVQQPKPSRRTPTEGRAP